MKYLFACFFTLCLAGCAFQKDRSVFYPEDSISKHEEQMLMRPHTANVTYSNLHVYADVDLNTIKPFQLNVDGTVLIGSAKTEQGKNQSFRWNLKNDEWVWLDTYRFENSALMGMNSTGEVVFGSQWFWQNDVRQTKTLEPNFWAYLLNEHDFFIGAGLDSVITMISMDGKHKKSWPVQDVLKVNNRGDLEDTLLLAPIGILISSTMQHCLLDVACEQAYLTYWTPDQGSVTYLMEMPERQNDFIQSNAGPQRVSQNGHWLVGSVGKGVYRWSAQGQMMYLGGFDNGGSVISISNDGKVVVGDTIGSQTKEIRSWIWTETEGLNWLDEWLRNHGVSAENISTNMQVKLLSPDRRVMIGVTSDSNNKENQVQVRWWRVDLPEQLRVLI